MNGSNSKSLSQISSNWLESRAQEKSAPAILIAEDSEADVFFILRAFAAAGVKNPVHVVRSGAETMAYLSGEGPYADRERHPMPTIVFLDLKMPAPNGYEILRWKTAQQLDGILWVAVSNFDGVKTINEAYNAGANTFLAKPLDSMDIRNLIDAFEDYWCLVKNGENVSAH